MKCDNVLTKQNNHPRILILGNAPTTGDEAIAIGLALLIREYFSGCHITLASQYPDMYGSISDWINVEVKDFNKLCPPIRVKEGLLLRTISRLSALEVLTFPFSVIGRIHPYMKKAYFLSKNYDVVFLQGGPGWKDHTLSRSRAITNKALWLKSMYKNRLPICSIGESFGPYEADCKQIRQMWYSFLVRAALKTLSFIAPRDKKSFAAIRSVVRKDILVQGSDTALYMTKTKKLKSLIKKRMEQKQIHVEKRITIGICFRDFQRIYKLSNIKKRYIEEAGGLIRKLHNHGYLMKWIPTDDGKYSDRMNDIETCKYICRKGMIPKLESDIPDAALNANEIFQRCIGMDLMLSVRLHPIIMASMMGVPCISISYTDKCDEYISDLGECGKKININEFIADVVYDEIHRTLASVDKYERNNLRETRMMMENLEHVGSRCKESIVV